MHSLGAQQGTKTIAVTRVLSVPRSPATVGSSMLRLTVKKKIKIPHNTGLCIMMTSYMETFSALLAICAGNSPVPGEFPAHRPLTRSFDVFFDLCLNKRLSKQSWGWWFETLSSPLWRHSDVGHPPVAGVSHHKKPVMRKAFPSHEGSLDPMCCEIASPMDYRTNSQLWEKFSHEHLLSCTLQSWPI